MHNACGNNSAHVCVLINQVIGVPFVVLSAISLAYALHQKINSLKFEVELLQRWKLDEFTNG